MRMVLILGISSRYDCLGRKARRDDIFLMEQLNEMTQRTVWHLLKILDPEGEQLRERNRLEDVWPQNQTITFEKLKPYRICINSTVDRVSPMVMWLHAYTTKHHVQCWINIFQDLKEHDHDYDLGGLH